MTDDALLSTPARSSLLESGGWQEGRMDEHQGRLPQGHLGEGGWEAPWLVTGGHPVGANPFSPPLPQAAGHYGAGYGDPQRHQGTDARLDEGASWARQHPHQPAHHDEHHAHFERYRREHEQRLDDDYASFRQQRFASEFEHWRNGRRDTVAPEHEGPLRSFGRAISEAVTGSRDPDLDALAGRGDRPQDDGTQREATDRFFERS